MKKNIPLEDLPSKDKVQIPQISFGEDSRRYWRTFNRHGQPENFSSHAWQTKGKKPRHKDHRN